MYPKMKYKEVPQDLSDNSSESMPRFLRAPRQHTARIYILITALAFSLVASNVITWFCAAKVWRPSEVKRPADVERIVDFDPPSTNGTPGFVTAFINACCISF